MAGMQGRRAPAETKEQLVTRLSASTVLQKGVVDRIASKLVRVMKIAQAQRGNDIEVWDGILKIITEDRFETPINADQEAGATAIIEEATAKLIKLWDGA